MSKKKLIATTPLNASKHYDSAPESKINIGLSACLAGLEVRYNGGHKQSNLCLNILSQHFNFKTFCPEVAAGFGTPRPTMRLIGKPTKPTLVFSNDENKDLTLQLVNGFKGTLPMLANLDGYILMKNSPSCGMERIKVYQQNGYPHAERGVGLFAQALKDTYPLMPLEEEGRLHDDLLYDNFIVRVYAYHNFRKEVLKYPSITNLINFHASYKYVLMAHDQQQVKYLGRITANHDKSPLTEQINLYFTTFMTTLSKPASRKNHSNVLLHLLGYLKKTVPSTARQHIVDTIHKYREGVIPLTTPLTLLTHYLNQYGSSYINAQRYLQPYPENIHPIRKHCH